MIHVFRNLSLLEIEALQNNRCNASDWSRITVTDSFNSNFVRNSNFFGDIRIGVVGLPIHFGTSKRLSGIYNSTICDSTIGDNCFLNNILGQINGVDIGNDVVIDNCYLIECSEVSTFGNGVKVSVLNEAGGREVPIFDRLSAQLAYLFTFYRYKKDSIAKFESLIADYVATKKSARSTIGSHAVLRNCGEIKSVNIGEGAQLSSVLLLENGTINSRIDHPTLIGHGVLAKDFIIAVGAQVIEAVNIRKCFIGESTILAKGFSAEECILLSNGQFYNGEACSIFAGPHTVTHHKSTLLIGGAYSFFNAGSGTNQSNHLYKIGPVHQGVTERGVKTGSDSYILWPAHIGCFTVVLGRHYNHPDISDLPFSYLIEKDGASFLIPGMNVKSIGTHRDISKWEKRDKRDPQTLDVIDYAYSNWYIIGKLLKGIDVLTGIKNSKEASQYQFKGVVISSGSLVSGIKSYRQAVIYHLGLRFAVLDEPFGVFLRDPKEELLADIHFPEILDLAGMFADKNKLFQYLDSSSNCVAIEDVLGDLKNNRVLLSLLDEVFYIRKYIWDTFSQEVTWEQKLQRFLLEFRQSVKAIHSGICADAKKEFNDVSAISFGVDGAVNDRAIDFTVVRGDFESQSFIGDLNTLEESLLKMADRYNELLNNNN